MGRYINAYAPVSGAGTVWTLYLGQNISGGPWAAVLTGMGQPNSAGVSPASFSVYYNNNLTNTTSAYPGNTVIFTVGNASLRLSVVQTFAGLYGQESWAKITALAVAPGYQSSSTSTTVQTTTIQPAPIIANAATTSYIYTSTAPQISIPANITISSNTISTGVGLAKEILGFISSLLSWIQAHIHISGFAT
ncbi:MAG: hypothetical protein M1528_01450 [Candidatus Marsarchaeota archaeon]|nr:hypothetical protein [Candidatus Marsarchaeota archaeon]